VGKFFFFLFFFFSFFVSDASNLETRQAAAEQISAIFTVQPDFLPVLLGRVVPLLVVSSWDSRVAAAHLLGLVARESVFCPQLPAAQQGPLEVAAILRMRDVFGSGKTIHGGEPDRKRMKESSSGNALRVSSGAMKLKERELAKSSEALALASVVVLDEMLPWSKLADFLLKQTESERWEARHGALLAIKALVENAPSSNGDCAVLMNAFFGCAFRVLVLDRFNDFMGDRVIAPVREVAAQVVGLLLERAGNEAQFNRLLGSLMELIQQEDWQLRHAGLLALRFFTNRRSVVLTQLAPLLIEPMLGALDAEDDDVIAVAAEVMLPAAAAVCKHSLSSVGSILDRIWVLVESLNEIAASIGCLVRLISAFYGVPEVATFRPLDREPRVVLLLPLFRHGVSSVRLAVVEMFAELLAFGRPLHWAANLLGTLLQACILSFATEQDGSVLAAIEARLWPQLMVHGTSEHLCAAATPQILNWFTLLSSDVKDCGNPHSMRVNGARAIARLLLAWPKDNRLPVQVLTLIKLLCSSSGRERVVGGLTLSSLFAPGSAVSGVDAKMVSAFCQKAQDSLMCDWSALVLVEDVDPLWERIERAFGRFSAETGMRAESKHPHHIRKVCLEATQSLELAREILELVSRWTTACLPRHFQVEAATTTSWLSLWLASKGQIVSGPATDRAFLLLPRAAVHEVEPCYQKEWGRGVVNLLLNCDEAVGQAHAPTVLRKFAAALVADRSFTPLAGRSTEESLEANDDDDERAADENKVDPSVSSRLSATAFFNLLGERLGHTVLLQDSVLMPLWKDVAEALRDKAPIQDKIDALRLVQVILASVSGAGVACQELCLSVVERLCATMSLTDGCWEAQTVLGEALASAARLFPVPVLRYVCVHVLPMSQDGSLNQTGNVALIVSIHRVLQELHIRACAFLAFMVVPVLGAMSHRDATVRRVAASAFAQVVSLMPLEVGTPDPPDFGLDLSVRRANERMFIQQLLGGEPPAVNEAVLGLMGDLQLRPYQKAGIAWLCFLARYQLHGILADDMGLGKTVQALCSISNSLARANGRPSLIVCPSSLVHHWISEATTLFNVFSPVAYEGSAKERREVSLSELKKRHNLIVVSYETLRKDVAKFEATEFLYCILDEVRGVFLFLAFFSLLKIKQRVILFAIQALKSLLLASWSMLFIA
jgi:hypothetical protein